MLGFGTAPYCFPNNTLNLMFVGEVLALSVQSRSECNLGSLHTLTVSDSYLSGASTHHRSIFCLHHQVHLGIWVQPRSAKSAVTLVCGICLSGIVEVPCWPCWQLIRCVSWSKQIKIGGLFQRWFHWLGTWQAIKSCRARSECSLPVGCRPQHL